MDQMDERNTPIITQNENGPCPLLAIMNVLLLAWKVNNRHD
uniref:Ubiquitin carboxyl-terminal hydrolase n=1 Tax=Anguilla anguilla TaxID=7936 RepID=A0A0E9PD94_ANGAN